MLYISDFHKLGDLEKVIAIRSCITDGSSYTASLVNKGIAYACKKMGEEVIETIIAALEKDKKSLICESADLIYHMMVIWNIVEVKLIDILPSLEKKWKDTFTSFKDLEKKNQGEAAGYEKSNSSDAFLFLNCRKMGEESIVTIMVALEKNKKFLIDKSTALICLLFLIWKISDVLFETVLRELMDRMSMSGLQEKANRSND